MGRSPCCDGDANVKKGPWTSEEDSKLMEFIAKNGAANWRQLPKRAGLNRCSKSCRLRWTNYLRPDIKRGAFSDDEEKLIINLHSQLGNRWSAIAKQLPGRTDNEIKNYWNTRIRKKLLKSGIDPVTHMQKTDHLNLILNGLNDHTLISTALHFSKLQLLQTLAQTISGLNNLPAAAAGLVNAQQDMNYHCGSCYLGRVPAASQLVSPSDVVSGSSPTSTAFDQPWINELNLQDDVDTDFSWKDILE